MLEILIFLIKIWKVLWNVAENHTAKCTLKGKSKEVWSSSFILFHTVLSHSKMLYRCCFPEGLPKLHSSTPSSRRRAAVRLWHTRFSTAVRLLGRLTLNLLTPHQYTGTCAGTRHSSKQLFPDFAEPWKLFPQWSTWRRQGKVLIWPLAEFHYHHGWWVESRSIFFCEVFLFPFSWF